MSAPKSSVVAAFSRAAESYEKAAAIQRETAFRLARRIVALPIVPNPRVLEIGAGTGILSRFLLENIPGGEWLLTDISAEMLEQCREKIDDPRAKFRLARGEEPPDGPFDLIVSSLAMQWLDDLPYALERICSCLSPRGTFAFTTLGSDTFREWIAAYQALGLTCGVPPFPSATELRQVLPKRDERRGWTLEEERFFSHYLDGLHFVRELRALGAHTPRKGYKPLPLSEFRKAIDQIGRHFRITHHVLFACFTLGKCNDANNSSR